MRDKGDTRQNKRRVGPEGRTDVSGRPLRHPGWTGDDCIVIAFARVSILSRRGAGRELFGVRFAASLNPTVSTLEYVSPPPCTTPNVVYPKPSADPYFYPCGRVCTGDRDPPIIARVREGHSMLTICTTFGRLAALQAMVKALFAAQRVELDGGGCGGGGG